MRTNAHTNVRTGGRGKGVVIIVAGAGAVARSVAGAAVVFTVKARDKST